MPSPGGSSTSAGWCTDTGSVTACPVNGPVTACPVKRGRSCCTFWLAQALADEVEAATATFERAVAAANDVGPLAEEVDPARGEMIGNFPQAFSHIGLINAAWAITQARQLASG
jgi:hypothetical protein